VSPNQILPSKFTRMKNFECRFLWLIAILATSFTIASHKVGFKTKALNAKSAYTCSTTGDIVAFWYCKFGGSRTHVVTGTPVSDIPTLGACTFTNALAKPGLVCNEANVTFCCFQPNSSCIKPSCAQPSDVAGAQIGIIFTMS
jgi:hypothetical protein